MLSGPAASVPGVGRLLSAAPVAESINCEMRDAREACDEDVLTLLLPPSPLQFCHFLQFLLPLPAGRTKNRNRSPSKKQKTLHANAPRLECRSVDALNMEKGNKEIY